MIEVPILRLELQGIKNTVLHALQASHKDIEALINVGIARATASLPDMIVSKVYRAVDLALEEAVVEATRAFFSCGGEGYEMILTEVRNQYLSKKKCTCGPDSDSVENITCPVHGI
jgi:hypothetical protein